MGQISFTYSYDDDTDDIRFSENKMKRLLAADKCYMALFDYDQYLRSRLKYEELSEKEYAALEAARTKLHDTLISHGVDLDDLE